jgi:uncharacterized hydrophobic protein (TIGR00341 family)
MAARLIEILTTPGHVDTLTAIAHKYDALDCRAGPEAADGSLIVSILAHPEKQQELIDRLQGTLGADKQWRIVILPVDATIPPPKTSDEAKFAAENATREELYAEIERGARLDSTFLLLVIASTVVAVIGLLEDNVAVVIGAMLIAPLLGPSVALALGATLGDRELIVKALASSAAGIALSVAGAALVGLLSPHAATSQELLSRTVIGYDSVGLAFASGAAAALSLTTRLSTTLVGVMVAVALLPPAATFGYMLGIGDMFRASGAGALLVTNVVCVNLAAQIVFLVKGIKPRTWLQRRSAQQSVAIGMLVSAGLLAAMLVVIYFRGALG